MTHFFFRELLVQNTSFLSYHLHLYKCGGEGPFINYVDRILRIITHLHWQVYSISLLRIVDIWLNPSPLACQRSLWMTPEKSIWMLVIFSLLYKFDEQTHSEFFYYYSFVRCVQFKKISKGGETINCNFFSREIGCCFFMEKLLPDLRENRVKVFHVNKKQNC